MAEPQQHFETTILVHLDKAYNLARWLIRDASEAEDMVQQACMRAYEAWPRFRGDNPLGWLLTIVRNTCFNHLKSRQNTSNLVSFDEAVHHDDSGEQPCHARIDPSRLLAMQEKQAAVRSAIHSLKAEYREALYLREIVGYSYSEIAEQVGVPVGTVMSRLSRARCQLRKILRNEQQKGQSGAV